MNDKWKYVFAGLGVVLLIGAAIVYFQAPDESTKAVEAAFEETRSDAKATVTKLNIIFAVLMSKNCYSDETGVYAFHSRYSKHPVLRCTGDREDYDIVRKSYPKK